ncbi:MAG TPA: chromate transporter [Burkholderiaceae bacterium]
MTPSATPLAPDAAALPAADESPGTLPKAAAEAAATIADAGAPSVLEDESPRTPRSPGEVFLVFTRLALQGFGGVLPIAQRELVERERWLTSEQFLEMLAVSQVLPGPNVVNLSLMFGDRAFGWRGALAALGGMLLAPLGVVLALAVAYAHYAQHPVVAGVLRGMGAVAAGLIFSTGLKLLPALRRNVLGATTAFAFAGIMFACIALLRVPLVFMLAGLGAVGFTLAWRRLAP